MMLASLGIKALPLSLRAFGGSKAIVRHFGNRQNFPPSLYSGPYTQAEVEELEASAMELKAMNVDQKKVNPWLRAKLGPYFREGWTTRVAARRNEAKRMERQAQRPAPSTHFVVRHTPIEGEGEKTLASSKDRVFAVVGLAGTQFKVIKGDVIVCNRIPQAEVGTTIELTDVLMVGFTDKTLVGRPNVPGYSVLAFVEQQARGKKQIAFYKRPKTYSQKMRGFRREVTILRIGDISCQSKEGHEALNTK